MFAFDEVVRDTFGRAPKRAPFFACLDTFSNPSPSTSSAFVFVPRASRQQLKNNSEIRMVHANYSAAGP